MSKRAPSNLPASVRARLLRLSVERKQDFQFVLIRYAVERLLYRLSASRHAGKFILKGAMLFSIWAERPTRPTRDLDLLGSGDPSGKVLADVFKDLCVALVEPDGLIFDPNGVSVSEIREDQEYGGQRVRLVALLERARIPLQVDVGFGDAVVPAPVKTEFPALLDFPPPMLRAYPKEAVVAEKLEAMVKLGMANSRMKDFFDLWILSQENEFAGAQLVASVKATFKRRKTALPATVPVALTPEFFMAPDKAAQWSGFLKRNELVHVAPTLSETMPSLSGFLLPLLTAASASKRFDGKWAPKGPWSSASGS